MKPALQAFAICIMIACATNLHAQQLPQADSLPPAPQPVKQKKKTSLTVSSSFISALHFYGRTDSLKSTALVPNVLVQFGNGIYLSSSFIFINNKQQAVKYAATVAGAGYNFGKPKGISGTLYADKFFYAYQALVQSSQQGQAGFRLAHRNKILDINLAASTIFSDRSDYFASAGVDHIFIYRRNKSVFVFIPTFTANAGTQNFTNSYYKTRYVNGIPVGQEQVTETSKKFQLLSFDASLPIAYAYKKLILSFTPGYVIPQNIIKVNGRPDLSENASDLFYANVGIAFRFTKK